MSFVRLPGVALVPHSEVERLRQKFAAAASAAAQEAFWRAIQDSRQPVIEENEVTFVRPLDYSELGALW